MRNANVERGLGEREIKKEKREEKEKKFKVTLSKIITKRQVRGPGMQCRVGCVGKISSGIAEGFLKLKWDKKGRG